MVVRAPKLYKNLPEDGCREILVRVGVNPHDLGHVEDGGERFFESHVARQGVNQEARVIRKRGGEVQDVVRDARGHRHPLIASGVAVFAESKPDKVVDHVSIVHLRLSQVCASEPVAVVGVLQQWEDLVCLEKLTARIVLKM